MFESLSTRLQDVFKSLRGQGRLTPENIEAALKEIRQALLEADVNFKVVKQFTAAVKERATGAEVAKSLQKEDIVPMLPSFGALVGTSLPMRRLFGLLDKIVDSEGLTVLGWRRTAPDGLYAAASCTSGLQWASLETATPTEAPTPRSPRSSAAIGSRKGRRAATTATRATATAAARRARR